MDNTATMVIDKPDGSQSLMLRRARVKVVRGPDRGASLTLEKPRMVVGTSEECELQLTDPAVSRCHVELRAGDSGYRLMDLDSTNGTFIGPVQIKDVVITEPTTLKLGDTTLRIAPTDELVEIPLSRRDSFGGLLGRSLAMRQVFATLEKVSASDATVVLDGESGTGKEVAALALHQGSSRAEGPFVIVDLGSIPPTLIENELFGHEQGAFTGAQQARAGFLEQADGGTLFLDEVGELPLELQPRLLRFLENRQVKRVGATRYREVDARVIAATNRQLDNDVKQGRFRQDLFFRLSVVRVELPPLRERNEDIVMLARHFARQQLDDPRSIITDDIASLLMAHRWPGNVRELRNMVQRLVVLPDTREVLVQLQGSGDTLAGRLPDIGQLADQLFHDARSRWQEHFECQYLRAQLRQCNGVVVQAARRAGLPRQSFHRLMSRHGIKGIDSES